jgi:eukaryotic-like serine/threonine-protein kinase
MQAFPLKGENGNYIYFPDDKETVIHAGAFSVDYIGFDVKTKEKVICRHLNPELIKINQIKLNLLTEALKLLKHENLVSTNDIIKIENQIVLITEYYEHYTLKDLLKSREMRKSDYDLFFIKIIIQILIALEFLHSNKISHCNLNPESIHVLHQFGGRPNFEEPVVRLSGLDLLKLNGTPMPSDWGNIKSPGLFYAAPEQVLGFHDLIGPHTDIYSVGMILYESVSKHHPMEEQTNVHFMKRMQYSTPLKNMHKIEELMFKIITKACIKKEFEKSSRYYTAPEIRDFLSIGIEHRFKSAKEFGMTLIQYLEHNNYGSV